MIIILFILWFYVFINRFGSNNSSSSSSRNSNNYIENKLNKLILLIGNYIIRIIVWRLFFVKGDIIRKLIL